MIKQQNGAQEQNRTADLTLTKGVLYQLSYLGLITLATPKSGTRRAPLYASTYAAVTIPQTLERVMGVEPTQSAWKAEVLPLNYTRIHLLNMVEGGGFEPPKAEPADLQSAPFGRSGTPPKNEAELYLS